MLLEGLNPEQAAAVSAPNENCLVLAGAGSGKTRVLIHRIAWLMEIHNLRPYNILAVTFTNKAAKEMRERLEKLRPNARGYWMSTFHGIAHKLLRLHYAEAGLSESFQVMDPEDQVKLIRQIIKDNGLKETFAADGESDSSITPKDIVNWIGSHKDAGRLPPDVRKIQGLDPIESEMLNVFELYQERCQTSNLLDFADLLLKSYDLLCKNEGLLVAYQSRFLNILVDEFQDTNSIQYNFIRLLAGDYGKVFAVGDDDQSIYGWRGAVVENVSSFLKDFRNAKLFKLEQNYRSTSHILNCANGLISNNPNRLGKNLWTSSASKEKVSVHKALDEVDEATYVSNQILTYKHQGGEYEDCAILYRSNAQSRALEEQLMANNIPYKIYGGLRFFERAEVKDLMCYLRLSCSPSDDTAFERIVNVPARGLGDKSIQKIRDYARQKKLPLFLAAEQVVLQGMVPGKAGNSLKDFLEKIKSLSISDNQQNLRDFVLEVLKESGLVEHQEKSSQDRKEKASRVENLYEVISVAERYEEKMKKEGQWKDVAGMSTLKAFLAHAALEASENPSSGKADHEPAVQLMTIHSSKGLEFPVVFLTGWNQGLFPSARSLENQESFLEERRLAYVGITRAMKALFILYANRRRFYGQWTDTQPSDFLNELPLDSLEITKAQPTAGYEYQYNRPRYS